jgi:hypothetical protein
MLFPPEQQRKLYNFIADFQRQSGFCPSYGWAWVGLQEWRKQVGEGS